MSTTLYPPPTKRDWDGVLHLKQAIEREPEKVAEIACFNENEADWIREKLLGLGVPQERFYMKWLVFK